MAQENTSNATHNFVFIFRFSVFFTVPTACATDIDNSQDSGLVEIRKGLNTLHLRMCEMKCATKLINDFARLLRFEFEQIEVCSAVNGYEFANALNMFHFIKSRFSHTAHEYQIQYMFTSHRCRPPLTYAWEQSRAGIFYFRIPHIIIPCNWNGFVWKSVYD